MVSQSPFGVMGIMPDWLKRILQGWWEYINGRPRKSAKPNGAKKEPPP